MTERATTNDGQMRDPVVAVEAVDFRYGRAAHVLSDLSFQVHRGESIAIMGPSGCGKTTLLQILAGLQQPTTGSIRISYTQAGLVHQEDGLLPWLTVEQNVEFPLWLRSASIDRAAIRNRALSTVEATTFRQKLPHELSGGMKRRVEIGRLIASNADLWLLDEPFEGLDFQSRQSLLHILTSEARRRCIAVILVTHNIDDALASADRVLVLSSRGTIDGTLTIANPAAPRRVDSVEVLPFRQSLLSLLSMPLGVSE